MNEGLFRVEILLNDVIPKSTYNAPTIIEVLVKIIKKPSVMKHIPRQPNEIVQTKIPGSFLSRRRIDPNKAIGIEIIPKINGKMKNIEFSYGRLKITNICTKDNITIRNDTCLTTDCMPRLMCFMLHRSDALMNHSAMRSHGRGHRGGPAK